ncbi:MAG: GHKL domain-containing protein [Holophagales bacterium]|nr:MAG: GHKL domain-containing protein [Holophagales bacterium]
MQSARHGIVVLDTERETLYFANREALAMLAEARVPAQYGEILEAFLEGSESGGAAPSRPDRVSRRFGDRLLGFSRYGVGRFRWVFFRDISESARLESIAEAIEISNSFAHVFAAVRHEIGNPINSVKMALSVLRKNLERFERETVLDYLDHSLADLGRVEDLLASLRSLSFYDDLKLEPLLVDEWMREFALLAQRGFHERGIALEFAAGAPGVMARVDSRALQQILVNLVANAAEAAAERQRPEIRIETCRREALVEIRVIDNGSGIRPELADQMFRPFFTTKEQGTGLGLVIVRRLLARMNGLVELSSLRGEGTTALVTLPEAAE